MNLRAALPLGTLGLLLGACSAAGDGQGDTTGLGTAGASGAGTSYAGAAPVGQAGTAATQPTTTGTGVTPPPPPSGAGGSPSVTPPPGAGGTAVIQPTGAGGVAPIGAGGAMVGAGGVGGAATTDPNSFSIQTATIPLAPGAEEVKCQNFTNPIGKDIAVIETDSEMISSHHMFVFHDPSFKDTNSVADCSGIEFHDLFHMAQTPSQATVYPPGVGRKLLGTEGLRVLVHLLNTTSDAKTAQVTVTFHTAEISSLKNIAVSLFLNTAFLSVPPGMSTQSRTSGALPADTNLLLAVSHMHSRAVNFTAKTSDGVMIYQGTQWNEPVPTYYTAPYPKLKKGTTINWACTYNNNTGMTLTFGESANTNEMCILAGVVYPDQAGLDLGQTMEWVI
ncbi:MAG TPA: hypothetical protein VH062_02780 [Polyangiaceae bacterium]|jgi:hypothetical protein|nr:hypothetical protein [Polyangiaceae bacterium]